MRFPRRTGDGALARHIGQLERELGIERSKRLTMQKTLTAAQTDLATAVEKHRVALLAMQGELSAAQTDLRAALAQRDTARRAIRESAIVPDAPFYTAVYGLTADEVRDAPHLLVATRQDRDQLEVINDGLRGTIAGLRDELSQSRATLASLQAVREAA